MHPGVTGERMIPLLPCASIDEIADFAVPLGFTVTYRQTRPNPYLALQREGIDLHYFGIEGFRPEDSYGTCLVVSPDPKQLFDAFAAGLRSRYGRLPMAGFPRITRPRRRKNADGFTGFSLVDPGGNWIRVTAARSDDLPMTQRPRPRVGWAAPSRTPSCSATRTATWTRPRRSSAAPSAGTPTAPHRSS